MNFDFVKHSRKVFIAVFIFLLSGMFSLAIFGLNLGIDFESGTRVEIQLPETTDSSDIEKKFSTIDLDVKAVTYADKNKVAVVHFLGMFDKATVKKVNTFVLKEYGSNPNISTVSPTIAIELAKNATYSVLIASVGIILYVTVRFEWTMSVATIIAMAFDVFLIIMVFSLLHVEINITFIAALLTVVGYSINDTIVTFDRIRENLKVEKKKYSLETLSKIVNKSLNETLARSINTVLTVLFASISLFIFGSESIKDFSFALSIGLLSGVFSSLFLASQLWLVMKAKRI
jgi:preprotein translocase SecF subunit